MLQQTCLLTNFIRDNDVVSCCDFIPKQLNKGVVIYEVIRVIDGIPLFYEKHVNRLYNSVKNSGFTTNLSKHSLKLRIKTLIEVNRLVDGNIKFQICFGLDNSELFSSWICPYFYPNNKLYTTGVSLVTLSAQRNNPNSKVYNSQLTTNVNSILSKNKKYEVLLVNDQGLVTEGSRSNIFFVKDNSIFTPIISSVLPGITRQVVLQTSQNNNIICNETEINSESISKFDGAFITGTSPKVLPIKTINNIKYNPVHPTIKLIINEYNKVIKQDIQLFNW